MFKSILETFSSQYLYSTFISSGVNAINVASAELGIKVLVLKAFTVLFMDQKLSGVRGAIR